MLSPTAGSLRHPSLGSFDLQSLLKQPSFSQCTIQDLMGMTPEELDALADPMQSDSAEGSQQQDPSQLQPVAGSHSQQQQQQGVGQMWPEPTTPHSGHGANIARPTEANAPAAAAETSPLFKWTSDGSMMEELLKAFNPGTPTFGGDGGSNAQASFAESSELAPSTAPFGQAARSPPSADPSNQQPAAFLGLIRSAAPSPQPEPSLGAMPASPEDMPTPQQSQSPSLDDCAAPASPSMRESFDGHSLSADGRQDYSAALSPSFGNVPETRQAPAGAARRAASQGLPGAAPLTLAAQDLIMDFGQPANSITSGFFQTARSRSVGPPIITSGRQQPSGSVATSHGASDAARPSSSHGLSEAQGGPIQRMDPALADALGMPGMEASISRPDMKRAQQTPNNFWTDAGPAASRQNPTPHPRRNLTPHPSPPRAHSHSLASPTADQGWQQQQLQRQLQPKRFQQLQRQPAHFAIHAQAGVQPSATQSSARPTHRHARSAADLDFQPLAHLRAHTADDLHAQRLSSGSDVQMLSSGAAEHQHHRYPSPGRHALPRAHMHEAHMYESLHPPAAPSQFAHSGYTGRIHPREMQQQPRLNEPSFPGFSSSQPNVNRERHRHDGRAASQPLQDSSAMHGPSHRPSGQYLEAAQARPMMGPPRPELLRLPKSSQEVLRRAHAPGYATTDPSQPAAPSSACWRTCRPSQDENRMHEPATASSGHVQLQGTPLPDPASERHSHGSMVRGPIEGQAGDGTDGKPMASGPPVFDCSRAPEASVGAGQGMYQMSAQYSMPAAFTGFHGSPAMLQDDVLESPARRAHSSSLPGYPRGEPKHAWAAPIAGEPWGHTGCLPSPLPPRAPVNAAAQAYAETSQFLDQIGWARTAGPTRNIRSPLATGQREAEHAAGQGRSRQGPPERPVMAERSASEPVQAVVAQAAVPVAHQVLSAAHSPGPVPLVFRAIPIEDMQGPQGAALQPRTPDRAAASESSRSPRSPPDASRHSPPHHHHHSAPTPMDIQTSPTEGIRVFHPSPVPTSQEQPPQKAHKPARGRNPTPPPASQQHSRGESSSSGSLDGADLRSKLPHFAQPPHFVRGSDLQQEQLQRQLHLGHSPGSIPTFPGRLEADGTSSLSRGMPAHATLTEAHLHDVDHGNIAASVVEYAKSSKTSGYQEAALLRSFSPAHSGGSNSSGQMQPRERVFKRERSSKAHLVLTSHKRLHAAGPTTTSRSADDGRAQAGGDVMMDGGTDGGQDSNPDDEDEKREARKAKNRQSAAASRARQQAYTSSLELKLEKLREGHEWLAQQVAPPCTPASPSLPPLLGRAPIRHLSL